MKPTVRAALVAFLSERVGTPPEIAAASGFTIRQLHRAIADLREKHSPLLANLRDGRLSPKPKEKKLAPAGRVIAAAMHSRTPLEQAWQ